MPQPLFQVDAFADRPFTGNPAAVCLCHEEADAEWMQTLAAEMNLAETAYVRELEDGYELRWFTPDMEVDLCGHATLASAHVLWTETDADPDKPIRFHSRSGVLTCRQDGDLIELDFPATPAQQTDAPPGLLESLGLSRAEFVGKSAYDYLVIADCEQTVRSLQPDFAQLAKLPVRGVTVSAVSETAPYDFVSRFFAPAAGVNEDSVTGSAHCCLGPYWQQQLGKLELLAYQASKRGGTIRVHVNGDRVLLAGQAVTILKGELA